MTSESPEDLPEVVVHRGRGVALFWLIPAVAIVIGGYMGWRAWQDRGVSVVITYPTAEWVSAGKTRVKFRSVDIGTVDDIDMKLDSVELHCMLDRDAEPYLTESAMFWIEHPRVGGGQISGLGTLLSGAYIGMRAGDEKDPATRRFKGLEQPPVEPPGEKGLRVLVDSSELYSVQVGTPVFYLQQQVGKVEAYELAKDGTGFVLHLFVREQYAHLVRRDSRFWNAGGIQLSASLGKIDLTTPSLASMLSGGVAFDSPGGDRSPAAGEGATYWLHPDRAAIDSYAYSHGGLRIVVEASETGGVKVGDRVSYRELTVGEVVASELAADSRKLRLHLNIQDRYAALVRTNTVFWNASGISAKLGLTGLHIHTESLNALLAGGVAFATPDPPGDRVKAGSVFGLKPEVQDEWLKWKPVIWRGAPESAPKSAQVGASAGGETGVEHDVEEAEGKVARFFHHEGKSEEDAAATAEPHPDAHQQRALHDHYGKLRRR